MPEEGKLAFILANYFYLQSGYFRVFILKQRKATGQLVIAGEHDLSWFRENEDFCFPFNPLYHRTNIVTICDSKNSFSVKIKSV